MTCFTQVNFQITDTRQALNEMWRAVCDESRKHGSEGGKGHLASQGTPTLPYHIQMPAKGPYTIKGYKVVVVDSEGNEIEKEGTVALYRCGLSNKKPFCDGVHCNCETL